MRFLALVLFLAACTQKQTPVPELELPVQEVMEMSMAPATINLEVVESVLTGSLDNEESQISFDNLYLNAKVSKRIFLTAQTEVSSLDISGFRNASIFTFKYSNCGTSLQRLRTCVIDIEFIPVTLGPISEVISLNENSNFELSGTVLPALNTAPTSAELNSNLVMESDIDLGDFTGRKKTARATILNLNKIPVAIQISEASAQSGFSYQSYCPIGEVKLKSKHVCQVEVRYESPTEEISNVTKAYGIILNNEKNLTASVEHQAPVQTESSNFAWKTPAVSFGATSAIKKQIVYIDNKTHGKLTNLSFNSLPSGLSILRSNCTDSLNTNIPCYIELQINPSQILDGAFAFDLKYSNSKTLATLPITATISGGLPNTYPCSLADAEANGWTITQALSATGTKTGPDVSLCSVAQCNSNYMIDNKNCIPVACTLANANISNAATVSGDLINGCVVDSCATNYTKENNQCNFLANITIVSGNNQSQVYSSLLSSPFIAEVTTPAGSPMVGVPVTWSVEQGSGVLNSTVSLTDAQGKISSAYTLGSQPGANSVKVLVNNTLSNVSFSATAITTPFTFSWNFDTSLNYSYPSSLEFSNGQVRLNPIDQIDDSNSTLGFATATMTGVAWDETTSRIRLNSGSSCNGALANCNELHSNWTPNYSNLVGYWRLNNSLLDTISGNPASANSVTPTYTANARVGNNAINFSGGNSAINLGDLSVFNSATSFSISGWFLQNDFNVMSGLFAKGVNDTQLIRARTATDGNFYTYVYNGTQGAYGYFATTQYITAGKWYHYAMVYNGAGAGNVNRLKVYINGMEVPLTYNGAAPIPASTPNLAGSNFELAENSLHLGSPSASINGKADDFAIWNTSLSSSAIKNIYDRQVSLYAGSLISRAIDSEDAASVWSNFSWRTPIPFLKGLPDNSAGIQSETATYYPEVSSGLMSGNVGLYHLDETSGTILDKSINAKNGTAVGGVTLGQEGKIYNSAKSNGSTGYINISSTSGFRQSSQLSVAVWAKGSGNLMGAGASGGQGYGGFAVGTDASFSFSWTPTAPGSDRSYNCTDKGNPGEWNHYAMTINFTAGSAVCYINGKQSPGSLSAAVTNWIPVTSYNAGLADAIGGRYINSWLSFNGSYDEISIWNRILASSEVKQIYRRVGNRIKYQIRSCATNDCAGVAWKGPDNTANTYFSEIHNMTTQSVNPSGLIGITYNVITFSNFSNLISNNRYLQYQAIFESDDANNLCDYGAGAVPCSPELQSATSGPSPKYSTLLPAITNSNPVSFYTLNSFTQTLGALGCNSGVGYNISLNQATWYWWNGTNWAVVTNPLTQNNTSSQISANLATIPAQIGTGSFYFKALLKSTGSSQCELDQVQIGGGQ